MAKSKKVNLKNFEEEIDKLEKYAKMLEEGDLPLEEAMKIFEDGMKTAKECLEVLKKAEQKVKVMVENESGEFREEDFPFEGADKDGF